MQIILTGATGLVGSSVLHHILSLPSSTASAQQISRVAILSRNPKIPLLSAPLTPTANTHTTIETVTHPDFTTYPASLTSQLKGGAGPTEQIAVIWALGMSQNDATSPEQYVAVTRTYAVNAARAFATAYAPRQVNFVYVSGEGATHAPGVFTPLFGRVKGETEAELVGLMDEPDLRNLRVYNVRPAAVDSGARVDGQKAVDPLWTERTKAGAGMGMKLARALVMPVLRAGVWGGMHSPTGEVGKVLTGLGIGDGRPLSGVGVEDGGWTLRNVGLRRLAKEMV